MGSAVILPGILLLLAFFLKLTIDREVNIPNSIYAFLELPVDTAFLSTSFIAAFAISATHPKVEKGLLYFVCYLLLSGVAVLLWRKACTLFEAGKTKLAMILNLINYALSLTCLVRAIKLI